MQPSKKVSILFAEDHADFQRLLESALVSVGHKVTAVASKRDALEVARRGGFDILISDYRLSDGSGMDLVRELRHVHGLRGICLSGYEESDINFDGHDGGFDKYLVKGVDFEVILAAIDEIAGCAL